MAEEKLPLWRKIGYGLGDIYGGGSGVVVSFYYLIFLTDVVRISPALAGTVILISKIYDAITDPLEGILSDRTRTRMGRRRPYLLMGVPLVFLSFFALFYPTNLASEAGRFAFVIASYLFFSTVVSIVMLNYNALQSELTLDYHERTSLSSLRIFFSTLASILGALLPLEIVKAVPDVRQGYVLMGLAFGALFALPFIATVIATRERREFQKPVEAFSWREAFVQPFRMKTFLNALMMYLLAFVAIDAVSSIVFYYIKYYIGRGSEANYVSGAILVLQVLSLPLYARLSRRTSKRAGFITGAVIWAAAMVASLAITPQSPQWAVYLFAAVVGIGTGGVVVMMYAIFPDIPDVHELVTGERREAMYSSLVTLFRKFSSALALFAVSNVIGWAGYVRPIEQVVNGAATLVDQPQSPTFLLALRLILTVLPIALLAGAMYFAARYPLTPALHARMNAVLAKQRQIGIDPVAVDIPADEQAERAELIHALVR
jgi:oligogalacturonide transporter